MSNRVCFVCVMLRYGDEAQLSSFMGVVQALVSFYADESDKLR